MAFRRHKCGRKSRMPEMLQLLKSGKISHPLAGNRALLRLDDVVVSAEGSTKTSYQTIVAGKTEVVVEPGGMQGGSTWPHSRATVAGPFAVGMNPKPETHYQVYSANITAPTNPPPGIPVASVAADFDGDGREELIEVRRDDDRTHVAILRRVHDESRPAVAFECAGTMVLQHSALPLCAAHLYLADEDALPALVLAEADGQSSVVLHAYEWQQGEFVERTSVKTGSGIVAAQVRIAATDLDGDGIDEVIVVAPSDSKGLVVIVCGLQDGTFQERERLQIPDANAAGSFDVLSAHVTSTGFRLHVVIAAMTDRGEAALFTIGHGGGKLASLRSWSGAAEATAMLALATADFDMDGRDEIVLGISDRLHVIQLDGDDLVMQGKVHSELRLPVEFEIQVKQFRLAAGFLQALGANGIFAAQVACTPRFSREDRLLANFYKVNPNLAIEAVGLSPAFPKERTLHQALVDSWQSGAWLSLTTPECGLGIRVGEATRRTFSDQRDVLAILKAPPWQNGLNPKGASLTYHCTTQSSNDTNVTVHADWALSDQTSGSLSVAGILNLHSSLMATYGEQFSNVKDTSWSLATSKQISTETDDLIIYLAAWYDVWEYPLHSGISDEVVGHVLFVFPQLNETQPLFGEGSSLQHGVLYAPDHIVGEILSYPSSQPTDLHGAVRLDSPGTYTVGASGATISVDTTRHTASSQSKGSHVGTTKSMGVDITIPLFDFGNIGYHQSLSGSYGKSDLSTATVSFTEAVSFGINLPAIQDRWSSGYSVSPIVYYSKEKGCLVLDYVVETPSPQIDFWATPAFRKPRPMLNRPFFGLKDGEWRNFTRSLYFLSRKSDVLVTARIGNHSFVDAQNVVVEIFCGKPNGPDSVSLGRQIIDRIPAREFRNVSVSWIPPKEQGAGNKPHRIYVQVTTEKDGAFERSEGFRSWRHEPASASWPGDQPD